MSQSKVGVTFQVKFKSNLPVGLGKDQWNLCVETGEPCETRWWSFTEIKMSKLNLKTATNSM